jgi:DNA repair exonuclease SbcCD ATPase subunit
MKQADIAVNEARAALDRARVVARVLGLKGVRAQILGRALEGLEAGACAWASTLSMGKMTLRLAATTAKKDGSGVTDAISVRVSKDGGATFQSYDSLSGGQRRRIDLALLLAISETASAADPRIPKDSTLFFDEAADALDEEGLEAFARVAEALAKDRCVVLISHQPGLIARFAPPDEPLVAEQHWKVDGGVVTSS